MGEKPDTFERLVLTMESSERRELLRQLAERAESRDDEYKTQDARVEVVPPGEDSSPERQFKAQPFVIRLWFALAAFFSATTPVQAYSAYMVQILARKLARQYSRYVDVRQRAYTTEFHRELARLREAQTFFSSLLDAYEANKGGFFVILSSLAMKKTFEAIGAAANPFSEPYDRDTGKDVRASCLRAIDAVLLSIPEDERARLYQASRAIEWIRRFIAVPVERMLLRFSVMNDLKQAGPLDTIADETESLATTLASARKIPILTLEAMYLFSTQDTARDSGFDLEKECSEFLAAASRHLSSIREFRGAVPVEDFVRLSVGDVNWKPAVAEGGEDWFQLFKNAWKKRFEERWSEWNRLHRISTLKSRIVAFLGVSEMPRLEYHPWEGLWLPLALRRELSVCFLKGLFDSVYPSSMMRPLKILLVEGDFYRRENLMEFTDAFSALEHQQSLLQTFETRLSPKGDIGEGFELIQRERIATVKGKARLANLMLTTESETELLISRVVAALRSLDLVLSGVIEVVRGGPYETLVNMASIQGKQNERFRKELSTVRQLAKEALFILSDAEVIEKESL